MSIITKTNSKFITMIIFAAFVLLVAACSAPAEKFNQQGNDAFAEQAYLDALELYQTAQIENPELAEPYYNAANTFYREGNYPAALEQMQMALQFIEEETLAESSFYNLGNTLFNAQDLGTAVEAYKQALLLDPADLDAKYNLELALQQQQEQEQNQDQQQEQPEDEQNQDQQDQQDQGESENQDQQDQSQGGENQGDQNQEGEGDQSEDTDQQDEQEGEGDPQDGEPQDGDGQPSQTPAPGQRMTEEQARQLLAAIAENMETLQEKLGQYFFLRSSPPVQDW